MRKCQNCGRFPFCEREGNEACEKWIKRSGDMKLNKKENGYFEFENNKYIVEEK